MSVGEKALEVLSFPPTSEELQRYEAVETSELPRQFKRDPSDRVFVNRSIRLDKVRRLVQAILLACTKLLYATRAYARYDAQIRWFGFDMDYTLAEYKHPAYDETIYELIKKVSPTRATSACARLTFFWFSFWPAASS